MTDSKSPREWTVEFQAEDRKIINKLEQLFNSPYQAALTIISPKEKTVAPALLASYQVEENYAGVYTVSTK